MAGMLDSEPVFQARLKDLKIPDDQFEELRSSGINTLGRFAYLCPIQPGSGSDDTPFIRSLLKNLKLQQESDLDSGHLAAYRRLWVEAYTVSISEIRNKVERTDETAVRKLPQPERVSRRNNQRR